MNADTFALMKPNAVLINTARGPIVDEKSLIAALQAKRLAGAALDVFEHEPLPADSPLMKMEQCHACPTQFQFQPSRVGASPLEHDQEFAGWAGDRFEWFEQ